MLSRTFESLTTTLQSMAAQPKAWLLTWNPEKYTQGGDGDAEGTLDLAVNAQVRWSCGSSQPVVGDAVYLLRLGVEPRGIIASGAGLTQSDFYQMFAYGHTYLAGAGELVLIYPHWTSFQTPLPPFTMPRPSRHGETSQSMHLWVLPFNLEGADERLVTSCEMACEALFRGAEMAEKS